MVTRDFGSRVLRSTSAPRVRGAETVMSLLARNARVRTRYGGGFVQSIGGVAGGSERGRPVDWFYYVNGLEAPQGAAATRVHAGDHIWWDRHDWSQSDDIPAVVGSFPEPFLDGIDGRRLPVRVQCADVGSRACETAVQRLRSAGAPAAVAALGGGSGPHTLTVLVAPWSRLRRDVQVAAIGSGPGVSGVYARLSADAGAITLLDQDGRAARTFAAGAGLVAATRSGDGAPVWVITGTDRAGTERAAAALSERLLRNRFAAVVTPAGAVASIPEVRG
jgi:hypothetical protein